MPTTTDTISIPLNHHPPSTNYRLLELPPEVESLLDTSTYPALTLDDAPGSASAILRTQDRTYALRQKNTSNALLVLSSSSDNAGIAVVATLHEVVELDALPSTPVHTGSLSHTGSRGKWHERFGKNR
ncbi:hypothetical protein L249_2891 [Ophiocordyceps polyrhachis-furcata BCC 54312]|uniref:Sister chromatid cohesion protein DCC1 n=1 Tax=Ophiocordyceps polyrhachis-furcata BCC 54312 TaxID=1330021 RepID=A0A367LSP0_9HYPO|nr:hypothetical protein L249_2891 [Ophiocordyceps polyrhachis-furcata BCC 54312]